ncbi:RNA-processing protein [archaeon]|nr:RNA-processing protein [archaeon]MBT3451099.1 RNA-processing protein [archaeon]MBT6868657.1 RNA-processing protein [archaeon]MBT7193376.1 RNA-processing protein [archaeon]MBT7381454.1 RNA-processing protein [archaeon]
MEDIETNEELVEEQNEDQVEQDDYQTDEQFAYQIKIPEERVAVLIGTAGNVKNEIEKETGSNLDISAEGDVQITGSDALNLFVTREIVRAIGRGFNPEYALELLKQDYVLEIMSLKDIAGKSQKTMERLKGRVIGRGGKSRDKIESMTNCNITVYGKTIGIIGETSDVSLARQAVAMLLQGSMHKTVFKFLEDKLKEARFGM